MTSTVSMEALATSAMTPRNGARISGQESVAISLLVLLWPQDEAHFTNCS